MSARSLPGARLSTRRLYQLAFTAMAVQMLSACGDGSTTSDGRPQMPTFQDERLVQGRSVWMNTCRNCHLLGIAGAPAVTNFPAWEPRIEKGKPALYQSALNGIRGRDGQFRMPPRGGNQRLSDDQVRMAVEYMVSAVRVLNQKQ